MFPRRLPSLFLAVSAASVLVAGSLTACGVGADNGSGTTAEAQETSFDTALDDFTEMADAGITDPYGQRGVSHAETVGDVTPIDGDGSDSSAAEDAELPVELTDADGRDVTVDDVSRIIPLDIYGTISRTLAGLGLRDNIVGRTVSSTEPSLQDLPVVTQGGHSINAEAVLNLNPSLVVVDGTIGPDDALNQLRDAGVSVVKINPKHTIDTVSEDIDTIAGIVGLPGNGERLGERADTEISRAVEAIDDALGDVPGDPLRMAFLYARGDGGVFYILGPDDGTDDLIESLGGVDAAKEEGIGQASPANAESLADLNPDVMVMMSAGLDSTGGLDGLLAKPGIAQTTAGQNERILAIPDSQSLSFGPQSGEMLLTAATALYGDATDSE
ncbi:MAG: heme/hemin ABC transporter substrate-binding protein [Corynebacterium sp.]|uniref:heme/hemin ABC transporter substrate-binding protein n=1 Tax=unclassified Corynebacterium TaxID=2624378 RepID=UPI002648120E|nr:ABC transporter substrate-binding protein [Corynebacterium sp.]MDN5582655.1 ABC transporter substrate-binding protein [Corynebacterium sp.]MDN5720186.1 ABC transporter substrate-binding protein [Corynebacterium sp.]MDN6324345.1 ABC transporter substrate-binding protein [Corynebacterium sp.]MDN6386707.1 ABC transporter substrate-binding protein [Corynebacterium sp.]MDN6509729.1 ABC transporter substrate-binding protein [Corynebacterium sp.]